MLRSVPLHSRSSMRKGNVEEVAWSEVKGLYWTEFPKPPENPKLAADDLRGAICFRIIGAITLCHSIITKTSPSSVHVYFNTSKGRVSSSQSDCCHDVGILHVDHVNLIIH